MPCSKFLENIPTQKLNCYAAAAAGVCFSLGWWLMIDVNVCHPNVIAQNGIYHLAGVFSTLSLLLVNMIPIRATENTSYNKDEICCTPFMAKLLLFMGFMATFGSLIGASYILVNDFLIPPNAQPWIGFEIFLQNLLIFLSNILLKFGIKHEEF